MLPFPDKPNSALTQLSVDLRNVAIGEGGFYALAVRIWRTKNQRLNQVWHTSASRSAAAFQSKGGRRQFVCAALCAGV